jgi:hypothetical protein
MKRWATRFLLGFLALVQIVITLIVIGMALTASGPSVATDPYGNKIDISGLGLPPGCYCHSSDAKVTKEHKAYGITDCAKCH